MTAVIAVIFSGCAQGVSSMQLKQLPETKKSEYMTNSNYQEEYIRVSKILKDCYHWNANGMGPDSVGEIYSELGKANTSIVFKGTGEDIYNIHVELIKQQDNKTFVKIYTRDRYVDNLKDILLNKKVCEKYN